MGRGASVGSVIGSGPNGLAAAIVLAQAGMPVEVFEAEAQAGGASRTLELTLPGFRHDFGSAVHPMGVGSPFFSSLPLESHGLTWIHGAAPLAHPLDDGTAVMLERDLREAEAALGDDGKAWRRILTPLAENWDALAGEILGPAVHLPRHPFLLGRFGMNAVLPANLFCKLHFKSVRSRALFAGLAAHSFLSLDEPLSTAVGLVLAAAGHGGGGPVPWGGAQAISDAMVAYLKELGGKVQLSKRIGSANELAEGLVLCDVSPRQLMAIGGERLSASYRRTLGRFE